MAEILDDELMEYLQTLNLGVPRDQPESSSLAASPKTETRDCVFCGDQFPSSDLFQSPCSHEYCHKCLVSLVNSSLQDESLFPPQCCRQPLPVTTGRWFSPDLVGRFRAKKLEYETPNRTYCSEPTCSTFVPPAFISGEVAECPKCSRKMCTHCKGTQHAGICNEDDASQKLRQLADDMGWQSCNACHRLIELDTGCYHITCPCGAQFCYICGIEWKNCDCPEDDLVQRVNEVVNHEVREALDAIDRDMPIQQERDNLIANHECDHDRWTSCRGPGRCERCNQILPIFMYQCRQCRVLTCRRCRYNRR